MAEAESEVSLAPGMSKTWMPHFEGLRGRAGRNPWL